jgi:hypothetical protein
MCSRIGTKFYYIIESLDVSIVRTMRTALENAKSFHPDIGPTGRDESSVVDMT